MIDIFYFDGRLKRGEVKDLPRLKNKNIWIDISEFKKEDLKIIEKVVELHPVTVEDLLLSHGRIKVESFSNYLFSTFYSIEEDKKKVKLVVMDYVLGKNFIISTHKGKLANYERLKKEENKLARALKKGAESVYHKLLDEQIEEFFPVLSILDDEIEAIDDQIALHPSHNLMKKILHVKKQIVEVKKITFPQRAKIASLAKRKYKFIPESSRPYFSDIYDQSIRISDIIENFRENISSTFDAYMTSVANSQSDIMKVLSIIATVALPLTVISGIYGTNFRNLPGTGAYIGFWVMCAIMMVFVVSMIYFFKRRNWF